jgi:hypothetical protein
MTCCDVRNAQTVGKSPVNDLGHLPALMQLFLGQHSSFAHNRSKLRKKRRRFMSKACGVSGLQFSS